MVKLGLLTYSCSTCPSRKTSFSSAFQDAKKTNSRKKYVDQKLRAAASSNRMLLSVS